VAILVRRIVLVVLLAGATFIPAVPRPSVLGGPQRSDLLPTRYSSRPRGRTRSASPDRPCLVRCEAVLGGRGSGSPIEPTESPSSYEPTPEPPRLRAIRIPLAPHFRSPLRC
jgi:hypothetical protein